MSDPPTARQYLNVHRVDAVCPHCDRWRELDAMGQGIELPLRCKACGGTGKEIKVSGRCYGLCRDPSRLIYPSGLPSRDRARGPATTRYTDDRATFRLLAICACVSPAAKPHFDLLRHQTMGALESGGRYYRLLKVQRSGGRTGTVNACLAVPYGDQRRREKLQVGW
jgi:hypothetical protein